MQELNHIGQRQLRYERLTEPDYDAAEALYMTQPVIHGWFDGRVMEI